MGLGLQTDKRPGEYAALAQIAERGGFDVVTTFNDLWYQPALPALLEIAEATDRVRIGPSCSNPFTVHPVELAGQTAVLDLVSRGRAFLGLAGRGAWLGGLGIEQRRPRGRGRGGVGDCDPLARRRPVRVRGRGVPPRAGAGLAYDPERRAVPLLVGTWSPRLTEFAAGHADELKLGGTANPAGSPASRGRARRGRRRCRRRRGDGRRPRRSAGQGAGAPPGGVVPRRGRRARLDGRARSELRSALAERVAARDTDGAARRSCPTRRSTSSPSRGPRADRPPGAVPLRSGSAAGGVRVASRDRRTRGRRPALRARSCRSCATDHASRPWRDPTVFGPRAKWG